MNKVDFNIALLHDKMHDKQGNLVTTSLTMIDLHDIARSARTYGVNTTFISHPSAAMRKLANSLKQHWEIGYGSNYNPNRTEALERIQIVEDLEQVIHKIDLRTGQLPSIIATSAKAGGERVSFSELRNKIQDGKPYLMLLGTGWGMSDEILERTNLFLEAINGTGDYNHLSVRSACAIMLDRLLAP